LDKPVSHGMVADGGGNMRNGMIARPLASLLFILLLTAPLRAAPCGGDFRTFLGGIARDAQAAGVSPAVIDRAFAGLTPDPKVMAFDKRQAASFRREGSFEKFIKTRVGTARVKRAAKYMQRYAPVLARVEKRFGVPKELLMAIWTMETDNGGGDMGKLSVIRTLATLSHDCRRTELFQRELIAALQILQRGDLPMSQMVGAYAGEIGQTQFLPSSYIKYGVDFDGNGHVDLRHSVPDVLASTANLLKSNGWRAGQPYDMGTENFEVMREWNRSEIYRRALVLFAHKLGG
jgi:lytic murein transglycosylase